MNAVGFRRMSHIASSSRSSGPTSGGEYTDGASTAMCTSPFTSAFYAPEPWEPKRRL